MGRLKTPLTIILSAFLVFSIFTSFSFNEAHACSCIAPEDPKKEREKFQVVFSGTVTEMEETNPSEPLFSGTDPVLVTFDVERVWKGLDEKNPTVTITTPASSVSCGFYFQENLEYVVYAYQHETDRHLQVSLCSRTNTIENAEEDLRELGEGILINSNESSMLPPLKQYKIVLDIHEIECKSHLMLIFKDKVGSPACVKPSSVEKLLERGWTTELKQNNSINIEK